MRLSQLFLILLLFGCSTKEQKEEAVHSGQPEDLIRLLDSIWISEQTPIRLRDSLIKIHGVDAPEVQEQQKRYKDNHIINEKKVREILDQQGWPDEKLIGEQGILTICNVIQHSDMEIRHKYLPMMKEAVNEGKLQPRLLARAEDRLATDKGELQMYGSQVKYYPETKTFDVWPIFDPMNVDKRRASIGLGTMADFLSQRRFQLTWDVEKQKIRSEEFEKIKSLGNDK